MLELPQRSAQVQPRFCGDGKVGSDEDCDDGNRENGDACPNSCIICGNGVRGGFEACDDGNRVDGDGSDLECRAANTLVWHHESGTIVDIQAMEDALYAITFSELQSFDRDGKQLMAKTLQGGSASALTAVGDESSLSGSHIRTAKAIRGPRSTGRTARSFGSSPTRICSITRRGA